LKGGGVNEPLNEETGTSFDFENNPSFVESDIDNSSFDDATETSVSDVNGNVPIPPAVDYEQQSDEQLPPSINLESLSGTSEAYINILKNFIKKK
jgi:hypothetical protein